MWVINEWDERYEVNDKGGPYNPNADHRRRSRLAYVRWVVKGRTEGIGWKRLKIESIKSGVSVFAAIGLFGKLLEVAADLDGDRFGQILDDSGKPADSEYLSLCWSVDKAEVDTIMPVLIKVGWVKEVEFDPQKTDNKKQGLSNTPKNEPDSGQIQTTPGASGNFPELPGTSGSVPEHPDCSRKIPTDFEIPYITETETETETLTKLKHKPKPKVETQQKQDTETPKPKDSDSDEKSLVFSSDSASDSGQPTTAAIKNKQTFILRIFDILGFQPSSSDHTAIQNLAEFLEQQLKIYPHIFDIVLAVAKDKATSPTIKNPKAAFFAKMKSDFGFEPVSRRANQ